MRQLLASIGLVLATTLVVVGLCAAAPARVQSGPATIDRLLPHAALLTFADGAFLVVPRGALQRDAAPGDLLDLQLRPLGDERLALAAEPSFPHGSEDRRPSW